MMPQGLMSLGLLLLLGSHVIRVLHSVKNFSSHWLLHLRYLVLILHCHWLLLMLDVGCDELRLLLVTIRRLKDMLLLLISTVSIRIRLLLAHIHSAKNGLRHGSLRIRILVHIFLLSFLLRHHRRLRITITLVDSTHALLRTCWHIIVRTCSLILDS